MGRWAQERSVSHLVSSEPMVHKDFLIDLKKKNKIYERIYSGEAAVVIVSWGSPYFDEDCGQKGAPTC